MNGWEFCEIMGCGYCIMCIKINRCKENDEEVINVFGILVIERFVFLFGDIIFWIKLSFILVFLIGRELFNCLNNFNFNLEYYVNFINGIWLEML